jgi:allantoinase
MSVSVPGAVSVVTGGTVVTSDGPVRADLLLRDGRIAAIMADASEVEAQELVDAAGLVVVPGGVDAHTHFREPDPRQVEGFDYGSRGALAGGITTAIEMPQADPTSVNAEIVRQKKALIEEKSRIDIALWGGVIGQPRADIEGMLAEGVVALKAFIPASSPSFPNIDDATMLDTFELIAGSDVPFGLHCENDSLLRAGLERLQASGRKDALAHAESRPPLVEVEAIHRAIFFAELTGARLYVCHVAAADGLQLIKEARARDVWVEAETCPQYLLLDLGDLEAQGVWARCAPAFRSRGEVERIWEYVIDGTVDVVSSDHCAYTVEDKLAGVDDIWKAPLGCSGVQTMYPGLLDEMVNHRGLPIDKFVELSSTNPARIFGLYPRKGVIQVGSDADLVFYDLERSWTVRGARLLHKNKWTPFEGKEIGASVARVLVRGVTQFDVTADEPLTGQAGTGNFLPRGYGATV